MHINLCYHKCTLSTSHKTGTTIKSIILFTAIMRLLQRLSTVVWNITMLYCVCVPRSRGESQIDETLSEPFHKLAEFLRNSNSHIRPPIIVLPGLMSTRLVAWKRKRCRGPDINVQDVVWLNLQKLVETMTYDKSCWLECIKLNLYNNS